MFGIVFCRWTVLKFFPRLRLSSQALFRIGERIQVPDFGDRFWVYQVIDQRTDSFVQRGKMYAPKPGFYLLAGPDWKGTRPAGITGVFHSKTNLGAVIPRVFMDDTAADRQAIQPLPRSRTAQHSVLTTTPALPRPKPTSLLTRSARPNSFTRTWTVQGSISAEAMPMR
jgi:hypothetical protein